MSQIIVGLVFATVSAAPLESTPSEKSNDSPTQIEWVRPSPINPDIPMDPKPPERIILDESKAERDGKASNDKLPVDHPRENSKSESRESEPSSDDKHDEKSLKDQPTEKSNDDQGDDKKTEAVTYNHDDKRESDEKVTAKSNAKELVQAVKSDEPIIVYAVKADEKQRSEGFETSHRIPNIDEGERKFETSHHIPTHIENERTKLIENAKIGQKPE